MKTIKVILALVFAISLNAQDRAIEFRQISFDDALAAAKKENKPIFMDCYTVWCGPCKWMSANVFPDAKVAELYNDKYINVKINMEKGEGILFAKAYDVRAYPTLMFIDAKGNMVHKAVGSRPVDGFVALGEAASDPDQQVGSLAQKYEGGNRDADFLMNYAKAMKSANMEGSADVAEEYLTSQKDWDTETNMKFIFDMVDFNMESKMFKHMNENRTAYYKVMKKDEVNDKLKMGPYVALMRKGKTTDEQVVEAYKSIFPDNYQQMADEHILNSLMYSRAADGQEKFFASAAAYMDKYEVDNWNMLNSIAWRFYELTDDPAHLEKARTWAAKSVEMDSNYMNNDTLAAIYFKLKDKRMAAKYAQIAIDLAKKGGDEAKETQELLKKINAL